MRPLNAGAALLFAAGLAFPVPAAAAEPAGGSLRILFIGNSLTYFNDLPAMLAALAKATGQPALSWERVLIPGASLEDHWRSGEARRAIGRGKWDFVVLQQGPSASPEGREMLLGYAGRFAREIRAAGGRPAVYMVWPSSSRASDFDDVSQSYRLGARQVDGLLIPGGRGLAGGRKTGHEAGPVIPGHLAPAGSYLAALVMFQRLYGQSPVGLPGRLSPPGGAAIDLPESEVRVLQEAAVEANRKFEKP